MVLQLLPPSVEYCRVEPVGQAVAGALITPPLNAQLVQVLGNRPYWRDLGDTTLLRKYERAQKADIGAIANTGNALQTLFAHPHPVVQSLRNLGMNGFERSGPIKQWVARRAMGAPKLTSNTIKP